jgi:hypothetical protein
MSKRFGLMKGLRGNGYVPGHGVWQTGFSNAVAISPLSLTRRVPKMLSNGMPAYKALQNASDSISQAEKSDRRFAWDKKLIRVDYA